jgi:hypothetical protein
MWKYQFSVVWIPIIIIIMRIKSNDLSVGTVVQSREGPF